MWIWGKGEAYEVAKRARVKNCMIANWVLSSGGCSCCCSECIGKLMMMLMMIWRERVSGKSCCYMYVYILTDLSKKISFFFSFCLLRFTERRFLAS